MDWMWKGDFLCTQEVVGSTGCHVVWVLHVNVYELYIQMEFYLFYRNQIVRRD